MSDLRSRFRHRLILSKAPVIEVTPGPLHQTIILDVGGNLFLRTTAPNSSEVIVGDVLTLYTEVLVKDNSNAQPR